MDGIRHPPQRAELEQCLALLAAESKEAKVAGLMRLTTIVPANAFTRDVAVAVHDALGRSFVLRLLRWKGPDQGACRCLRGTQQRSDRATASADPYLLVRLALSVLARLMAFSEIAAQYCVLAPAWVGLLACADQDVAREACHCLAAALLTDPACLVCPPSLFGVVCVLPAGPSHCICLARRRAGSSRL